MDVCTYGCVYVSAYACSHICVCMHVCVHERVCTHEPLVPCPYMYMHTYVCMHVCMYAACTCVGVHCRVNVLRDNRCGKRHCLSTPRVQYPRPRQLCLLPLKGSVCVQLPSCAYIHMYVCASPVQPIPGQSPNGVCTALGGEGGGSITAATFS